MYDAEMMQMLNLIHMENQYIFEIVRAGLFLEKESITFDPYQKEYERIMKSVEKCSPCLDCSYKSQLDKIKSITRENRE